MGCDGYEIIGVREFMVGVYEGRYNGWVIKATWS